MRRQVAAAALIIRSLRPSPDLARRNDLVHPDALTPLLYGRRDDSGISQALVFRLHCA